MLRFKSYLDEAKFAPASVEKVITRLHKIFNRRLGRVFRYAGKKGYVRIGPRQYDRGYLFLMKNRRAFRINFLGGNIESISLWNRFKIRRIGHPKADMTIHLNGLNIVQVINKITEIIKHPRVGEYPIAVNESYLLGEARRTTTDEFFEIAQRILGDTHDLTSMKEVDIKNLARQADVSIPSAVWNNKTGRGRWSLDFSKEALAAVNANKPQLYITVGAKDPVTNKFIKADDNAEALELANQIRKTVLSGTVVDDVERRDPVNIFGKMLNLIKFVARGKGKSLFIYGGSGTGKSFEVMKKLNDLGLTKGKDWFLFKSNMSTAELYKTLFMYREENKVLVFDDLDSIFGDPVAANILKAALDSYDERVLSWRTARNKRTDLMSKSEREEYEQKVMIALKNGDDNVSFPNEFEYKGKIIFISNLKINKIDAAVLNRSTKIDMTLSPDEMFTRMRSLVDHIGDDEVPRDTKLDVIDRMEKMLKAGKFEEQPSIRKFKTALDLAASGIPDWYNYMDNV